MPLTRRDVLRFAGATAAGMVFSPLPWKLLDDVAIWTQTGPWIPKVPRGPLSTVSTACTICPAGCGVQARCVAGIPTSLRGRTGDPLHAGALCPIGLTGHHLAFHPLRVPGPCLVQRDGGTVKTIPLTLEEAVQRLPSDRAHVTVMVIDQRPGRALSGAYRRFIAGHDRGYYVAPDEDMTTMCQVISDTGSAPGPFGVDLGTVRTILAIGSPVLDGWTTPARTARLLGRRGSPEAPRVLAADARRTRTVTLADQWIPLRPDSEKAFLLGLTHFVLRRRSHEVPTELGQIIAQATPEAVGRATGLREGQLQDVADQLLRHTPSVVIVGGDGTGPMDADTHRLAVVLNALIGATDTDGAIQRRTPIPVAARSRANELAPVTPISSVPDACVDLVILDGEEGSCFIPWEEIERTLRPEGHVVVSLSPFLTRFSAQADMILPSPAPYESLAEATGDPTDPVAMYALGRPLHPRRPGSVDATALIARLSGTSMTHEQLLQARVEGFFAQGRGHVVRPSDSVPVPLRSFASKEDLWTALNEGAVWMDDGAPLRRPQIHNLWGSDPALNGRLAQELLPRPEHSKVPGSVVVLLTTWAPGNSCSRLSPLMTKLYQESELRSPSPRVTVAVDTADALGLEDGDQAELRYDEATLAVQIHVDPGVAPGTVLLAAGPNPVGLRTIDTPTIAHAPALTKSSASSRSRTAELRKT